MLTDEAPNDSAAEKARADAEARRQRILEKSRERMGVVSGVKDDDDEEEEEAAARTSKMQALRRRRFKQAAAAREAREEEEAKETAEKEEKETKQEASTVPAASDANVKQDTVDETETTEKKYKGVAKMRREMIKKKQQQREQTSNEPSADIAAKIPVAVIKPPINRLPIVLHLLTTILLFAAGLDIGWNQVVDVDVTVHRELAPREHGPGILNRNAVYSKADRSVFVFEDTAREYADKTHHEDEFSSTKEQKDDDYSPNIDPLFGIDLDSLTKGDDLFHMFARLAVGVHRIILRLFYYLPLSIFKSILSIPSRLLATPPILCLISLALRQGSKVLLGAGIPDADQGGKSKDVLEMVKNGVLNFISGSFPTAVALYDMFNHLRSDMYVILCGVFVGLSLTHHGFALDEEEEMSGEAAMEQEELLTTGDEL
jgi:hypothetical protein